MSNKYGFPTKKELSTRLQEITLYYDEDMREEEEPSDEEEAFMDVRLQVFGGWQIHTGDSSYDQDHRGYWGSGYIRCVPDVRNMTEEEADELAEELIDMAKEAFAMDPRNDGKDPDTADEGEDDV